MTNQSVAYLNKNYVRYFYISYLPFSHAAEAFLQNTTAVMRFDTRDREKKTFQPAGIISFSANVTFKTVQPISIIYLLTRTFTI